VFLSNRSSGRAAGAMPEGLGVDARYRALVEQMPAVVFMAYLDQGVADAYVSPQIEAALGFSQQEWLEDPIRWYQQIHPDDKSRWSVDAGEMLISGGPLRSVYRVIARDGRVRWFHCQAGLIRRADGRPWFLHGVGIDVTELKEAERALQEERNLVSTILETVGALVAVLDPHGSIVRFNRACERASGRRFESTRGLHFGDLFGATEEADWFRKIVGQWAAGSELPDQYGCWSTANGDRRIIAWSGTVLRAASGRVEYIIATGNDVTERERLQGALFEISGREQRRIGQDLHDGLGQHLTGTAFMSKVLQRRLEARGQPEAVEASKIVGLVNEAIEKTRELARGLVPVVSGAEGLMVSLQRFAREVEDLFSVSCGVVCDAPVSLDDVSTATNLFHIAQEAVNNAIKHGKPSRIEIALSADAESGRLTVSDDGLGIGNVPESQSGVGLHIMRYRAGMIGGTLDARPVSEGAKGTIVDCRFRMPGRS
jgi:PAS domain S-box-containing protein